MLFNSFFFLVYLLYIDVYVPQAICLLHLTILHVLGWFYKIQWKIYAWKIGNYYYNQHFQVHT